MCICIYDIYIYIYIYMYGNVLSIRDKENMKGIIRVCLSNTINMVVDVYIYIYVGK